MIVEAVVELFRLGVEIKMSAIVGFTPHLSHTFTKKRHDRRCDAD
jgi:hypothetical protein